MNRDQVKKQMRVDLEAQLTPEQRNSQVVITYLGQDYTAEQAMQEVEKDSDLGNFMVDEYLYFQQTGHLMSDETETAVQVPDIFNENFLDQETRNKVIDLMQKDLDASARLAPTWADTPSIADDDGKLLTPREAFQQVKDGTKFGNEFAEDFLANYTIQVELCKILGVPMPDFNKEVDPKQSN